MKRFAQLAVLSLVFAAGSGCCLFHGMGGCGGCGGCSPCGGACGYGAGYGGGYPGSVYSPTGYLGTAMTAGAPVYTASAPVYTNTAFAGAPIGAPVTAYAPMNPLPTY